MSHYDDVYSQDTQYPDHPHGSIQWKGTDVCIDLHCACGAHGHVDGSFVYYYQCHECGARYALGFNVKLIALTEKQANYVDRELAVGFHTDEDLDNTEQEEDK